MNRITTFRLVLVLIAAVLLIWGMRTDAPAFRLAAIACLAIALVLRFVKPGRR